MSYKPTSLDRSQLLISRSNLIFCLCPSCAMEINWRHQDSTHEIYASCCNLTFIGRPMNDKLAMYICDVKPYSTHNVIPFPKRRLHLVQPPPKRTA